MSIANDKIVNLQDAKVLYDDLRGRIENAGNAYYGTSSTAGSTRLKVCVVENIESVEAGNVFFITFDEGQTYDGNPQLQIQDGSGTVLLQSGTVSNVYYGMWNNGETVPFVWDGTEFKMVLGGTADFNFFGRTKLTNSITSRTASDAVTPVGIESMVNGIVSNALPYDTTTSYVVGDRCVNMYDVYECIEPTQGAWTPAKWKKLDTLQEQIDGIEQDIVDTNTYEKTISEANAIQTFEDGANWPMGMQIAVNPVQDLHGYSNPWPAGGGKNIYHNEVGNATSNGVTYTVQTDGAIKLTASSGATNVSYYNMTDRVIPAGNYTFSGCPAGGSNSTYKLSLFNVTTQETIGSGDVGSGSTFTANGTDTYRLFVRIDSGYNPNGLVFKPMICLSTASEPTTYAPYSNICHISGFDGTNVTVTGKNLLNTNNITDNTYINVNGTIGTSNNYCLTDFIPVCGTFTMSGYNAEIYSASLGFYDANKNFISGVEYYKTADLTCVLPEGAKYVRVSLKKSIMGTQQMEYGTTGTVYEPFGKEYSISFPGEAGTIYGGTLTVNKDGTGTLVVDRAYYEFDGSEDEPWVVTGTNKYARCAAIQPFQNSETAITNNLSYNYIASSNTSIGFSLASSESIYSVRMRYVVSPSLNETAVRAWLAENPLQLVYELASPVTYSLTPGQVLSLLGQNNVWADTGNILSLTYNSKQGLEFIREDTAGQIRAMMPEPQEEKRIFYATCDTAAATRDKVITVEGVTEYKVNDTYIIKFTNAQDYNGAPRLNVNGLGVKTIRRTGAANATRYQWLAGEMLTLVYDGTYMVLLNNGLATTTYYGLTKLSSSITSTSSVTALTPAGINAFSQYLVTGVGLYDATATYSVGDRIRYSSNVYECTTPIETPEALNLDHWRVLPAIQTQIDNAENGMAIMISGDVAPRVIYEGKYVYLKNHSTLPSGLYHTTAYIYAGSTISSSNVVADSDGGFNVLNDFLAVQKLTVTRTENNYCTSSDLIGINAYKTGNMLMLCSTFRTSGANGGVISTNTEIASITGWSAQHIIEVNVPYLVDGSKVLCVKITSDGKINIASTTGVPSNMVAYFTASVPAK